MIPQKVRDTLSHRFTCWKDVPKEDKTLNLDRLELQFVYDRSNIIIMDETDRLAAKSFREWRYSLTRHWKKLGGEKDKDVPKYNPPKKKISEQNSASRATMRFESCHGSRSILSHLKEGDFKLGRQF
ncbi:hypothetical protein PanWU01x14_070610 [Parasponia andersonii]|uniref:Uncharacterized protein n=1 Tax=Parasponia andersonii TaxID=3476 RepID=A0A2P5DF19_PARAD|nr:hypothetical protein PanWU01x14_070610 [Parasponia andersonii]